MREQEKKSLRITPRSCCTDRSRRGPDTHEDRRLNVLLSGMVFEQDLLLRGLQDDLHLAAELGILRLDQLFVHETHLGVRHSNGDRAERQREGRAAGGRGMPRKALCEGGRSGAGNRRRDI